MMVARNKRIMIVEDEGVTALRIRNALEASGYTVASVEVTGEDASRNALKYKPDLILMDVFLAGKMDGIQAADKIHLRLNVPIVFLTAYSDQEILERIKTTDPFGYIIKPFDERDLQITVELALYKHEMELQLQNQNVLLNNIIESLTHPFYVINVEDYTIALSNLAARRNNLHIGNKCYVLTHHRNEPCSDPKHPCTIERILKTKESVSVEHIHYDSEGNERIIEVHGYPIFDGEGKINQVIEYNLDITERKNLEKRLEDAAITDELTGLYNRRGFFTFSENHLRLADRRQTPLALFFIDLDGMKTINDELGHKTGDQALRDTADILRRTFRASDIIARIGGDEFAVLLTEQQQPGSIGSVTSHIEKSFSEFNMTAKRLYELMVSIGVASYDYQKPCSVGELLSRADTLMYEEKKHHKRSRIALGNGGSTKAERRKRKR